MNSTLPPCMQPLEPVEKFVNEFLKSGELETKTPADMLTAQIALNVLAETADVIIANPRLLGTRS